MVCRVRHHQHLYSVPLESMCGNNTQAHTTYYIHSLPHSNEHSLASFSPLVALSLSLSPSFVVDSWHACRHTMRVYVSVAQSNAVCLYLDINLFICRRFDSLYFFFSHFFVVFIHECCCCWYLLVHHCHCGCPHCCRFDRILRSSIHPLDRSLVYLFGMHTQCKWNENAGSERLTRGIKIHESKWKEKSEEEKRRDSETKKKKQKPNSGNVTSYRITQITTEMYDIIGMYRNERHRHIVHWHSLISRTPILTMHGLCYA